MRQSQVKEVWDGGGRGRVGRGKTKEEYDRVRSKTYGMEEGKVEVGRGKKKEERDRV